MYREKIVVPASLCGPHELLRLSSLLSFFEEASISDVVRAGYPREKTFDKGLLWVVSLWSISIDHMPKYEDSLRLSTYALRTLHRFFPRFYLISGDKGLPFIRAAGMWCLISSLGRKIIDPLEHGISIRANKLPSGSDAAALLSAVSPLLVTEKRMERIVQTSDLDLNGHMANYRYADWFADFSTQDLRRLRSFKIAFHHEATLGEKVNLAGGKSRLGSEILVGSVEGKGIVFQAEASYR